MTEYNFYKYAATGNDFILVDNREGKWNSFRTDVWQKLCERQTGIGADGVIKIQKSSSADFRMVYLNADGREVEMCGNGVRSSTIFCHEVLKIPSDKNLYKIETKKGVYEAEVLSDSMVKVKMTEICDPSGIELSDLHEGFSFYIKTGVPHCVFEVANVDDVDIDKFAKPIRHDSRFENGCNVNIFSKVGDNSINIRTFERGVEAETLSCGTGAVATALGCKERFGWSGKIKMATRGGELQVELTDKSPYLIGPVCEVYFGKMNESFLSMLFKSAGNK